ncbi:MAG: hypothetical protein WBM90_00885 [Acidimicrobiia bacterium]
MSDLIRPIRDRAETLERRDQKSVRADSERIHGLAAQLEMDSAPAYAIFASDADDIFILEPLAHPTVNISTLGPRPYMRPLRAAPRGLRCGVVVADRTLARTFVSYDSHIEEIGPPIRADIGKANYGGFAGYDEHNVRARANEASARIWKEASWRMLEEHQNHAFDYFAIGGHDEMIDEIARSLHPYLARLQRATFVASPHKLSIPSLRSAIRAQDLDVRKQRQEALAGRVCDTAWSGGNAVVGLSEVLEAINAQAVDTLVVAGPFRRDGSMCNNCGHLARTGERCPVCGSTMFVLDDVVGAAMDAAVAVGGRVHQVDVPSPLDNEGVGALTRFPVAV